jgi:hypothetical protein
MAYLIDAALKPELPAEGKAGLKRGDKNNKWQESLRESCLPE